MKYIRLKEILTEKGVSGKELAEKLGVSENTISFIATGKTQPRFELLEQIANYLNIDIKELFYSTKEANILNVNIEYKGKNFPIRRIKELKNLLKEVD
jgi:transcriptional regulator with XRE-family HTH domain